VDSLRHALRPVPAHVHEPPRNSSICSLVAPVQGIEASKGLDMQRSSSRSDSMPGSGETCAILYPSSSCTSDPESFETLSATALASDADLEPDDRHQVYSMLQQAELLQVKSNQQACAHLQLWNLLLPISTDCLHTVDL
jgi:hypothetical protein